MELVKFIESIGKWADYFNVMVFLIVLIASAMLLRKWPIKFVWLSLLIAIGVSGFAILTRASVGSAWVESAGLLGAGGQRVALGYALFCASLLILLARGMKHILSNPKIPDLENHAE